MRRLMIAAALLLLMPGAAAAQVTQTPPPVTYDDVLRLVARDAYVLLQTELGTGRFTLDENATKVGVGGMTDMQSVVISVAGATPAEWETALRAQLPAKVRALAVKVGTARLMGLAPIPTTDGVTIFDPKRGIALSVKSSLKAGVTGKRSLTLAVLVGK